MIDFVRYILTAAVCLSIAYSGFRLFINNRTGFHQQRFFLMSSLVISFLIPATGFTLPLPHTAATAGDITGTLIITDNIGESVAAVNEPFTNLFFSPLTYIIIYVLVSALLLLHFLMNLIRIFRLYLLSGKKEYCGHRILVNSVTENPFSFFGWIFIPGDCLKDEESGNIIIHEGIHASQYHSADNILVELTAALMWFNPIVWMMKRSVHLLHEYLADEGTLGRGIDRLRYQSLLLNQVAEGSLISLSSSFNNSLKKRISMMTNYSNRINRKGRIFYILPLGLIMFFAAGIIRGLFPEEAAAGSISVTELRLESPIKESSATYNQDTSAARIPSAGKKNPNTPIYVVDGKRTKDISKLSPDSIESITVLKKDNLIIITTKEPDTVVKEKKPDKEAFVTESGPYPESNERLLYIIDGEESEDKEIIQTLDPRDIESISVLRSKESMKEAGKEGYDGIIVISTKKEKEKR